MSLAASEDKRLYTAFRTDYVHFEIEEFAGGPGDDPPPFIVCHARFERWSLSILRECHYEWICFRRIETRDILASPQYDDFRKWEKFVSLFGFTKVTDVICNDGRYRPLYIHRVDAPEQ